MLSRVVVGLFACLFFVVSPVVAKACHHSIGSVTLNPTTACFGDPVQVTVEVELYGEWYDIRRWGSTSIDGVCYDHANYYSDNGRKTFTEAFIITAPGTQGLGNVQVKTFRSNGCQNHQKTVNVDLTVIQCCPVCEDGDDCTVDQGDGYVTITCGDTVAYIYDGEDGEDGEPGPQGEPGADGESCYVTQEGDCAVIYCGDKTMATICDGEDGEDGVDGTSCTVERRPRGVMIYCGESQAFVPNGLSCWDLNGNRSKDFCDPFLREMFDGECPVEFWYEYPCETPDGPVSKARAAAQVYEGSICEVQVGCVEYLLTVLQMDEAGAVEICSYTEDVNGDEVIDVLDCQGDPGINGNHGSTGPQGEPGENGVDGERGEDGAPGRDGEDGVDGSDGEDGSDGLDGLDGEDGFSCVLTDLENGLCKLRCAESTVIVHNCGIGADLTANVVVGLEPEVVETPSLSPAPSGPCGSFGGLTLVAMLFGLGFMKFRS